MKKMSKFGCGCLGILFLGLLFLILASYAYYEWIWEEWPVERIERVTGVSVPSYKIIETNKGNRFGGFTSKSWGGYCKKKFDKYAFVFNDTRQKY